MLECSDSCARQLGICFYLIFIFIITIFIYLFIIIIIFIIYFIYLFFFFNFFFFWGGGYLNLNSANRTVRGYNGRWCTSFEIDWVNKVNGNLTHLGELLGANHRVCVFTFMPKVGIKQLSLIEIVLNKNNVCTCKM